MMLDDRTEIKMMTMSETIETKIKGVITEIGVIVIVMMIDDKTEMMIVVERLETMTGESTTETDVIVMMTCEEKTGTEGIDETVMTMTDKTEIVTTMIGETEIVMTTIGDVKTETGETTMIAMMRSEEKIGTEGIELIEMILADVKEIAMPMWIDDEKIEIGETITIAMMICEGITETGETVMTTTDKTEIVMTTIGETEIVTMLTDDVKTEIGGTITIEMMI